MYDVIVIGARCAGAPTAMLLARKGYKVLLVDRAEFPSDIPHGHFIHSHGPRRLQRWGLLERVASIDCPPVTSLTWDLGDFPLVGKDLIVDGAALGYTPRRATLDQVLVDAAVEAGVELRQGFAVQDFLRDGERISGIQGQDIHNHEQISEQATLTVGADGRNSRLARAVRAPVYAATAALTCWYFSYWSGVPLDGLGLYVRGMRVIFTFPTNHGLTAVFVGWPAGELPELRRDPENQLLSVLDQIHGLGELVRGGKREERMYGATDVPNFLRKPFGPGWALVGDAGCHKDPFMALGICDAFRDAELLADALDEGLSGQRGLQQAMAGYEAARNELCLPDYHQNIAAARFEPPADEILRLRAGLRYNPQATTQFFLANEGMIPPERFFNPQNLQSFGGLSSLDPPIPLRGGSAIGEE
jgi:flavin-dependent dehydrogenase